MLSKHQIVNWLLDCEHIFTEQRDYLTALDTDIGDGDHGLNMQRGFTKVAEKLPAVADKDIGQVLKTTGMTLLSSVGGASGPLYGTFFLRFGVAAGAVTGFVSLAPPILIQSVAGLALIGAFSGSAVAAFQAPETREAAAVTFLVTASGISILGISGAFWGLIAGVAMLGLVKTARKS